MNTTLKEINLLNDQAFKSLFRSIEAREMVAYFLSSITGIKKEVLIRALGLNIKEENSLRR